MITGEDKRKAISCKKSRNNLYKKGNYQDALWFYEIGLQLDPGNPDILHSRVMVLDKLNKIVWDYNQGGGHQEYCIKSARYLLWGCRMSGKKRV